MADKIDQADGKDMYKAERDNNSKAAEDKTCKPNSTQTMIQSRYASTRNIGKNILCPWYLWTSNFQLMSVGYLLIW